MNFIHEQLTNILSPKIRLELRIHFIFLFFFHLVQYSITISKRSKGLLDYLLTFSFQPALNGSFLGGRRFRTNTS